MENYMKLELAALSENESFARSAVAAFALPLCPTFSELSDIKTAVSEAVTNCIVHAYKGEGGKILIECRIEKSMHYGCGIENVEEAIAPFFTTLEDDERSGMGFTVMQTFSTFFKVESEPGKGTRVSMQKAVGM